MAAEQVLCVTFINFPEQGCALILQGSVEWKHQVLRIPPEGDGSLIIWYNLAHLLPAGKLPNQSEKHFSAHLPTQNFYCLITLQSWEID